MSSLFTVLLIYVFAKLFWWILKGGLADHFKPDPLKRKILAIKRDMKSYLSPVCKERYSILWFGTYYINPKYLGYWITVKTDDMKMKLQADKQLMDNLKNLLAEHDYPESSRNFVGIFFESQQTVDRVSGGDWHVHLK